MASIRPRCSNAGSLVMGMTNKDATQVTASSTDEYSTENSIKADEPVNVLFLGSGKVGKTSIIRRFLYNQFDTKYTPTVEDVHNKKFIANGHFVRLVLIDTAGSFDFPAMLRLCIAKASAFVIVFSHDNADSLKKAGNFLQQIRTQRKEFDSTIVNHPNDKADKQDEFSMVSVPFLSLPPITVVCNKSDLSPACSQVSEQAIMEWLLNKDLKPSQFVYSSAKSNDSILSVFKSLWSQNEISKAIPLEIWNSTRRGSLGTASAQTPPHSLTTNFSALTTFPTMHDRTKDSSGADKQRSRSGFFRNSFRLSRHSSAKTTKSRSDIVKLDCITS